MLINFEIFIVKMYTILIGMLIWYANSCPARFELDKAYECDDYGGSHMEITSL